MLVKIATWNVNSLNVRLAHVLAWLEQTRCDILAIQETKQTDDKFPQAELDQAGYTSVFSGQKTYNGVAILIRKETMPAPQWLQKGITGFDDEQKRLIAVSIGSLRVICGYFPNGESLESDKFQYKMRWINALRSDVSRQLLDTPELVLLGDFNVAPTDADVHDPALWEGKLHCSDQERQQFKDLLDLGLYDAFRLFEQPAKLYSWWDYRQLGFRRNAGLRIDHILVSRDLRDRVQSVSIDKGPRKLEKPSDHTPVIATINLNLK